MVSNQNSMSRTKNHQQDQQSRVLYELSSQILNLIRYPPTTPVQFSNELSTSSSRRQQRILLTPAGFASLLLGISLALMLCGSITFIIGFLLMPWVLGLVMVFYVIGIVSSFVVIFRAIFYQTFSSKKGVPAWKLL